MFLFKYCRSSNDLKAPNFFVRNLLAANKSKLQLIYQHPFNKQLFAGTLDQSIFGRYLRDDFLYLHEFSSAINNIAQRTSTINPELANQLSILAHDVITNEQCMQLTYANHFNDHADHQMGAAVTKYTKYLIDSSVCAEIPSALSSILPCFWIYYQLGVMNWNELMIKENPYNEWIATYSSPEFIKVTKELAATVQLISTESSEVERLKISEYFSRSIDFELEFFNEIYPLKTSEDHIRNIRRYSC